MKLSYFQLRLRDGKVMNFNKECNKVSYSNDKVCIFMNTVNDSIPQRFQILAIVPYNQIGVKGNNICITTHLKI